MENKINVLIGVDGEEFTDCPPMTEIELTELLWGV